MLFQRLKEYDPEMYSLIKSEEKRQRECLELIASENFTSVSVLEVNGSILTNKYSEGQVGMRYYGGNEYIDQIESLCKKRALELYKLDPEEWDVNVQALSGSAANLAVYLGLVGKDGKIMGLSLPSGGHLSHGYSTAKKKISASGIFFNAISYECGESGEIDYEELERKAAEFNPDLIICGGSAYPREFDYRRLREIAGDKYLMMDMAHVSGLIAAGVMENPFRYCDVVTTTTHKILRGPRSSMIFYRKCKKIGKDGGCIDMKAAIDFAVFPGLQGGPHNQKIGALAVALKQANSDEYKSYAKQVVANAKILASALQRKGYRLYSGGTDCHMILLCLDGVNGSEVEKLCDLANITVNKNCISTDKSPLNPTGLRLGTPAMTTRGFKAADFEKVADFVDEAICIAKDISGKSIEEATRKINKENFYFLACSDQRVLELKQKVIEMVRDLPFPCLHC